MAPPKGKGAAARSNPAVPPAVHDLSEDPASHEHLESLDDDNGASHTPPSPDLEAELVRLREALAAAQGLIAALQQANPAAPPGASVPPPIASGPPPVAVAPAAEPKVNKPTEFSGKLSEYSTFISQCLLTFTMCPVAYRTDKQKALFVISYLSGTPRKWANRILQDPDHVYLKDFSAFKKALDAMYSDRNLKQKARDRLGKLAQTKSVAAYAAEFQEVVMPLDLQDDSLMSMFYKGLNIDVKKALIYFPEVKTFDELVDQCVSIDQRQFKIGRAHV